MIDFFASFGATFAFLAGAAFFTTAFFTGFLATTFFAAAFFTGFFAAGFLAAAFLAGLDVLFFAAIGEPLFEWIREYSPFQP
ncbi:MAG: hypothetical protein JSU02_01740 [Bacteroidetes bacterium]|nr:hypothetical protein [Bacteroidota bacterium]